AHHMELHVVDEHGVSGPVAVVGAGRGRDAPYPAAPVDLVEAGGGAVAVAGGPCGRGEGRRDADGPGEGGRRGERAATAEVRHAGLLGVMRDQDPACLSPVRATGETRPGGLVAIRAITPMSYRVEQR